MAKNSKIEWTHHTANLWWGCSKVHAGCDNCYAEALSHRYNHRVWGNDNPRKATKSVWRNLLTWQAEAAAAGEMRRVFVGSMMDIFEKPMPITTWDGIEMKDTNTDWVRQLFFNQYVEACSNLHFLLLTKRPSNILKYIPESWKTQCPTNVMFGTSISHQGHWHEIILKLRQYTPKTAQRFLSIEPQIDRIAPQLGDLNGIDWVIQGGESGHGKRPFDLEWARLMQYACKKDNVPYFFKQIDKVQEIPDWALVRQFPTWGI